MFCLKGNNVVEESVDVCKYTLNYKLKTLSKGN